MKLKYFESRATHAPINAITFSIFILILVVNQINSTQLFLSFVVDNSIQLFTICLHLLCVYKLSFNIKRFFLTNLIKHIGYLLNALGIYLYMFEKIQLKIFFIFLILAIVFYLLYYITGDIIITYYEPNCQFLGLLFGFMIFTFFLNEKYHFISNVLYITGVLYLSFVLLMNLIRICKNLYLFYLIRNSLDLGDEETCGLRVSLYVSVARSLNIINIMITLVVLFFYMSNQIFQLKFILSSLQGLIIITCVVNIIINLPITVWIFAQSKYNHTNGTGYLLSQNKQLLFNTKIYYYSLIFQAYFKGDSLKKQLVMDPSDVTLNKDDLDSNIPTVCSMCNKRKPEYIIRPCNHVILCKKCQQIRFNKLTNCWACLKPIDSLWAFKTIKKERGLLVYKVVEVKKSLKSDTKSN